MNKREIILGLGIIIFFIFNVIEILRYVCGLNVLNYVSWQVSGGNGYLTWKYWIGGFIGFGAFLFLLYPQYLNNKTMKLISEKEVIIGLLIALGFVLNVDYVTYNIWNAGVLMALDNEAYGYSDWFGFFSWMIMIILICYVLIISNLNGLSQIFYIKNNRLYLTNNNTHMHKFVRNFYVKDGKLYAKNSWIFKRFKEKGD